MELHKQVEMNEIALHCNLHEFQKCNIRKEVKQNDYLSSIKTHENFPGGPVAENACC